MCLQSASRGALPAAQLLAVLAAAMSTVAMAASPLPPQPGFRLTFLEFIRLDPLK